MSQRRVKNYKKMIFFTIFTFVFLLSALPTITTNSIAPSDGSSDQRAESPMASGEGTTFFIQSPAPYGDTVWNDGEMVDITWVYLTESNYMKIELLAGGIFDRVIATNLPNSGSYSGDSYSWQIPVNIPYRTDYQIRITDTSEIDLWRASSSFTILSDNTGVIHLNLPNAQCVWRLGKEHEITWNYVEEDPGKINIDLYKGESKELDIVDGTANDNSYIWEIPMNLDEDIDYKIKIIDAENTDIRELGKKFEICYEDTKNNLAPLNLLPGDILMLRTAGSLIPGWFSHCGIYCGTVNRGEAIWCRVSERYMDEGEHYYVDSSPHNGNGMGFNSWRKVNMYDDAWVLRVLGPDGVRLTEQERWSVVNWAEGKVESGDGNPTGPVYDFGFHQKSTYENSYYCSELIWAAYKVKLGIDLDADEICGDFHGGVAPDDLMYSQYTSVIGVSNSFQVPSTISKVIIRVDNIIYLDIYDDDGVGEMCLHSTIGLKGTNKATEEAFGFLDAVAGDWVNWNKKFYMLMPNGHDLMINIQALEVEDYNGFNYYGPYYGSFTSSTWMGRIDKPWKMIVDQLNTGDCMYTISAKVESAY